MAGFFMMLAYGVVLWILGLFIYVIGFTLYHGVFVNPGRKSK
ncbi:MAG: hypothetical protein ACE5NJ_11205 [Thermodesulfobacteriota bacterium]